MEMKLHKPWDVAFDHENMLRERKIQAIAASLNINLNEGEFSQAFEEITTLYELRNTIYRKEVEAILLEKQAWPSVGWKLKTIEVKVNEDFSPEANVVLQDDSGAEFFAQAIGDTTVEAVYSAIEQIVGIRVFIVDFNFTSLAPGMKSLGQAKVTIRHHRNEVEACAHSVDFLEAIAKAFLMAIDMIKLETMVC